MDSGDGGPFGCVVARGDDDLGHGLRQARALVGCEVVGQARLAVLERAHRNHEGDAVGHVGEPMAQGYAGCREVP